MFSWNKIITIGLFIVLVVPQVAYAQPISVPTQSYCLGHCPTIQPSAAPTSTISQQPGPSVVQPSSASPNISTVPAPSSTVNPCATGTASIKSAKSGQSAITIKQRPPMQEGLLQLIMQFLIQLLQLLLQQLGIQLPPLPGGGGTGSPCPTPSIGAGGGGGVPSSSPSSGTPSSGAAKPTSSAGQPTSGAAPTTGPTSSSCTSPVWSTSNAEGSDVIGGYTFNNDAWNGTHGPQTIYVCSYNNWYAVSTQTNQGGAVETYPDVDMLYSGKTVSSFSSINSSFADSAPTKDVWEAAYDIWINGYGSGSTELMIWNDVHDPLPGGSPTAATIDGVNYNFYKDNYGHTYYAFVRTTSVSSGSVNIQSIFNYLTSKGLISSSATLTAIQYGFEIVSTNGAADTFKVTNFSLTAN